MIITSRNNPKITFASSLKEKKYRDREGLFLLEGKKLFEEALKNGVEITDVFCTEDNGSYCASLTDREITVLSESAFEKISTEKSPQGVICVAKYIDKIKYINKIIIGSDFSLGKVFFLSEIRDPGNIGTIVRTANAMGIDEIVMSSDCADVYNPRTVRAAMGALFRQKMTVVGDVEGSISALKAMGYVPYAAMLDRQAVTLDSVGCGKGTVFVIGNEGHGLSDSVAKACGRSVFIPIAENTESLNAAAAAAILLWEMRK